MSAIRRYARQIVEEFQPEKVILFGSYSRGDQREGSDVDLLVVMPARNVVSQAIRIRLAVRAPFAMDLIVRTPEQLRQRIADGNWFLREITETGVVLYAKRNRGVDQKGRSRLVRSTSTRRGKAPSE
ncbi:MAG: nucleotidyltransferase domain-containing protein [Planctomycetaceae bacterium]